MQRSQTWRFGPRDPGEKWPRGRLSTCVAEAQTAEQDTDSQGGGGGPAQRSAPGTVRGSLSRTPVPAAGALRPLPRRQDPSKQPRPLRSVQGGVCPGGKLPPLRSLIRVQLSSVPHTNWVLFCWPQ